MISFARRSIYLLVGSLVFALPTGVSSQVANPDPTRFAETIETFLHWDTQNYFPERGIVFVGSSSIVRWPSADHFPGLPLINRGFGGSHISDVNYYIEETVLKYAPEVIVFYAGNNDINADKTPEQVFADYQFFAETVLSRLPETQLLFVSIHPSTSRWAKWAPMVRVNDMVKAYSDSNPRLHYVDIASGMLGRDGQPNASLLVEDGLHLSPAGYEVWTTRIAAAIAAVRPMGATSHQH